MPTTSVEKLSPTRTKINITVTPEELKPAIKHAYEHIAEQVSIPGFRKGKVPAPLIDQRVGKAAVLEHAVGEGLDGYFRAAVNEHKLRPLGRPEADITTWPSDKDFSGDLEVTIEVDTRPEIELPDYNGLKLSVADSVVSDADVDAELDRLRSRFGTLAPVDRPVKTGDFVTLDLTATIDGETVDTASGVSYEVGSGELLAGIDEALDSLTAGEATTFTSELVGGDHAGKSAEVSVTVLTVKERELAEADDDFAQVASEFDTIAELRESLKEQAAQSQKWGQVGAARDALIEKLLELVEIPVAQGVIDTEVHNHLEGEGRLEDDEHRAEVIEESTKAFKVQILLDAIAEREQVQVGQDELMSYLVQSAQRYGMDPSEFVRMVSEAEQIPAMVGEVARNKAISIALGKTEISDASGNKVDLTGFIPVAEAAADADAEAEAEAPAKPAKKAAAKKPAAKKAAAAE
ncbi:MAG TPA: trigger factor [Candidatus Lumbricidophila sp.]|nr:trigger factor [Candidatus Lumbricidophila sp.]